MHLIEKQHRSASRHFPILVRFIDGRANVFHPGHDGRQRDEVRIGCRRNHACERRLAGARRPPENHRVRPSLLERASQRLACVEQVRLPGKLVQAGRAHPVCQRPPGRCLRRRAEEVSCHRFPLWPARIDPRTTRTSRRALPTRPRGRPRCPRHWRPYRATRPIDRRSCFDKSR